MVLVTVDSFFLTLFALDLFLFKVSGPIFFGYEGTEPFGQKESKKTSMNDLSQESRIQGSLTWV